MCKLTAALAAGLSLAATTASFAGYTEPVYIGSERLAHGEATTGPIAVDSLSREDHARFQIWSPDLATLQVAHRDILLAANQVRHYLGEYPPRIRVAVLGALDNPARVNHAELREAGADWILDDWPAKPPRPGKSAPADPPTPLSERAGRWFTHAYANANERATAPPGGKLVPDWFEVGIGGLCLPPPDQARRVDYLRSKRQGFIPLTRLFTMSRPAPPAATPAQAPKGATRSATPGAAQRATEQQKIFDAEAMAFLRFVVASEDERLVGVILQSYLRGQPETDAINTSKNLYSRYDLLEQSFLKWIETGTPATIE
jgi:hypothetical protein